MPASALALRGLRPKRGKWPAPAKPLGIEGSFARDLRRLFDAADAIMLREVTADPELAEMTERLRGELGRTDAVEPERTGEIEIDLLAEKLYRANIVVEREQPDEVLIDLLQRHGRAVDDFNLRQVRKGYKAALGIDVVGAAPHGPAILKHYVADNVALIKKVRSEHFQRIEETVARHWRVGDRWETIADKLRSDLGLNANRAALIARDQVGKLNAAFSRDRHETLGVKEFIWRTSLDGRVRAQHRDLEGKRFAYAKGGHPVEKIPGWPIRCRCYAEPVFEDEFGDPEGPMGGPLEQDPFPEHIGWARTSGGPGRRTARPWSDPPRRPEPGSQPRRRPPPRPEPAPEPVVAPRPPEPEPAAVARARAEAEAAQAALEAAAEALRASEAAARSEAARRQAEPVAVSQLRAHYEPLFARDRYLREYGLRDLEGAKAREAAIVASESRHAAKIQRAQQIEAGLKVDARGRVIPAGPVVSVANEAQRRAAMDEWIKTLSEDEIEAIRDWTRGGYVELRAADSGVLAEEQRLNNEGFAEVRLNAAFIRSAMARAPRYEGVVYRGMHLGNEGAAAALYETLTTVGSEYNHEGIASWAWQKSQSDKFARDESRSIVLKVRTTRGVSIDDKRTSDFEERETEILIDRGFRFRVVSVTDDPDSVGGRKLVELEEID